MTRNLMRLCIAGLALCAALAAHARDPLAHIGSPEQPFIASHDLLLDAGQVIAREVDPVPASDSDTNFEAPEFRRVDDQNADLFLPGTAGEAMRVAVTDDRILVSASMLASNADARFVLVESILTQSGSLQVRSEVRRYDAGSTMMQALPIPITAEFTNSAYVVVGDDQNVSYLQGLEDGIVRTTRSMDGTLQEQVYLIQVEPDDDAAFVEPGAAAEPLEDGGFDRFVRGDLDGAFVEIPEVTREGILERSREYATHVWRLREANFADGLDDRCLPQSIWRRPDRLSASLDMEVVGLPYRWGGSLSTAAFTRGLDNGKVAGDDCTCGIASRNYCIEPSAVGIDCSGFVSQVWKIPRHTTRSLPEIALPIDWQDLKAGDILNKAGSHVRLFVRKESVPELRFRIIESSTSCGGVCERWLRATSLNGYVPLRHPRVVEALEPVSSDPGVP